MAAPVNPVVVDELVIGTLGPASRSLVVLVGEDGDGCGGGNVRDVVEAEMGFSIESAGGNARVGQPIERRVVEDVGKHQVSGGVPVDRVSEHSRGEACRNRNAICSS